MQVVERVESPVTNSLSGAQIDAALQSIYGNLQEETKLQKTRRIMGSLVLDTPDEQLEIYITEFEYLITNWLDEYERQVYDGLTLKELLQE